jgi:BirA family biotin operon repressor/biotin-[acetyl-CoA-carboxylase] ligase
MQLLSREHILNMLASLDTSPFGSEVHYYSAIGSTNDAARELASAGAPEGTLVIANEQTAGRGRMGRQWHAPPDTSLLMSIILRPRLPIELSHRLVMACGLAVADACSALTGLLVQVKWPNDLQIGGKKLAGLLAESAIAGNELEWVVVGIGLNVNQVFDADHPLWETATSLRMVSGTEYDRAVVLAQSMARLKEWYSYLDDERLTEAWRERCITLGQRIRVSTPAGVLDGLAENIDASGALWLQDDSGRRHRLTGGEATLLRP